MSIHQPHTNLMKLITVFLFCITLQFTASAQENKYVFRLKDKGSNTYTLSKPWEFLSGKAILRRQRQHIDLDSSDLPVSPVYLKAIKQIEGVEIFCQSKWLNQVCVEISDVNALAEIEKLPFIYGTRVLTRPNVVANNHSEKFSERFTEISSITNSANNDDVFQYGYSSPQIRIHRGEFLHDNGFRGMGMTIAILDAGFFHYKSLAAFDSVRNNNRILGTYDFVANETSVDEDNAHGMYCFSTMAANLPGQLIGSAPEASFYLFRTEDAATESLIEEQNWAAAAEKADSLGVDMISTSLGYTTFDDPSSNHTYADMNGNTTIAAKAADMAARKGILVVASAGNSGAQPWHYIGTPADADSILAVGAVDTLGTVASFSSYGPSSDGQVKPAIASVGVKTALAGSNGQIILGNGTSFAAPNVAGLIACLWQAFPSLTNMDIIEAVEKSSDRVSNPDDRTGYGIPNFQKAFEILQTTTLLKNAPTLLKNDLFKVLPNPATDLFTCLVNPTSSGKISVSVFNLKGQFVYEKNISGIQGQPLVIRFNDLQLPTATYLLRVVNGKQVQTQKLIVR